MIMPGIVSGVIVVYSRGYIGTHVEGKYIPRWWGFYYYESVDGVQDFGENYTLNLPFLLPGI